jgi:signal transduction histidine kinase
MTAIIRRWLPRSLAGQMALLIGGALLIAQIVNFALILNERQKLSLAENEGPAITRFAEVASDVADAAPQFRDALISDSSFRGARFAAKADSGIAAGERDEDLEARLTQALTRAGVTAKAVRAARGPGADDRRDPRGAGNDPRRGDARGSGPDDVQILRLAIARDDGWLSGRMVTPRRDPLLAVRLGAATLIVYLIVLGAAVWIAARIARPLRDLKRAADRFEGRSDPIILEPRGPDDLARAMAAFNAMNRRVVSLLDEKDHMLGAIGHDLRTPLASLRIRIESMEPEEERVAAVAKIAEMTAMLEDILVLARSGRAREASRSVDLTELVASLADDYEDLGQPVTARPSPRQVVSVQPDLLRRALRNLIDNAIKYGGDAELAVAPVAGGVEIAVTDHGPGIPADEIERVLKPFHRVEGSRNRATGGTGLGLAIATSIVESHGGRLRLELPGEGGLRAVVWLPV